MIGNGKPGPQGLGRVLGELVYHEHRKKVFAAIVVATALDESDLSYELWFERDGTVASYAGSFATVAAVKKFVREREMKFVETRADALKVKDTIDELPEKVRRGLVPECYGRFIGGDCFECSVAMMCQKISVENHHTPLGKSTQLNEPDDILIDRIKLKIKGKY